MKSIIRACIDEYRNIFFDAGVMLILFGAMLIYPLFYPFPYSAEVLKKVSVGVVDLDKSQLSRKLVRMMDAHELLSVTARPVSLIEAEKLFYSGDIKGIVVVPESFSKDILEGRQTRVAVYCDAGYFLLYRQMLTGVLYSTGTLSAGITIKRMTSKGIPKQLAMIKRDPLPLLQVPLFNPAGGYATYVVPAVLILILQQTLLIGIGMVRGTRMDRRPADSASQISDETTVGAASLLAGKTLAYFFIYLFHIIYITVILFRFYRFPQRGTLSEILLFLVPFILSIIFLGFTISALFRSREASMTVLLFTSLPFLFLAGFSWPVESIPAWLRLFSQFIPSTTGIDGFMRIGCMGASLKEMARQWATLWGLSIFYFFTAWASLSFDEKRIRRSSIERS
jgi:ABC-2 type transport system permease protein